MVWGMSSKPINPLYRSLAFRLTLWYAAVFLFCLSLFFTVFYFLLQKNLSLNLDEELKTQLTTLESVMGASGLKAVENMVLLESRATGDRQFFFRLLYPTGVAFSSSNLSGWHHIQINKEAISRLFRGERYVFETNRVTAIQDPIRIIYGRLDRDIFVQLGRVMHTQGRMVRAFNHIFLITIWFFVLVSTLMGWLVAKRALRGLNAITQTAQEISMGNLQKRAPVSNRGDEVDLLGTTFNTMLDRINELLTGIRDMSDNITHDLKSPITRIRGNAEIVLTTNSALDDFQNMAANTIASCDQLLEIINTSLMIAAAEKGVMTLEKEAMDLAKILAQAQILFQPMAAEKNIELKSSILEKSPLIGDKRLIQRMIANLLDNAIKYTPCGGWVETVLSCEVKEAYLITIQDNGIGIPPQAQTRVFERFYRCDTSRSQEGSGLGLSLSLSVAKAHGGDISLSSTPQKGSRFTVRLPQQPTG